MAMPPQSHTPLTLKKAKALHRKGNTFERSVEEQRRLQRSIEAEERAEAARQREKRRKEAAKKRAEKESRERGARRRNGVGMATQMAGFSHTQINLKKGMESFLGLKRKNNQPSSEVVIMAAVHDQDGNLHNLDNKPDNSLSLGPQTKAPLEPIDDIDDSLFDDFPSPVAIKTANNPTQSLPVDASCSEPDSSMFDDDEIDDASFLAAVEGKTEAQRSTQISKEQRARKDAIGKNRQQAGIVSKAPILHSMAPPPRPQSKTATVVPLHGDDMWDEFWDSNTQIQNQLAATPPSIQQACPKTVGAEVRTPLNKLRDTPQRGGQSGPKTYKSFNHRPQPVPAQANTNIDFHDLGMSTQDFNDIIDDDIKLSFG